MHNADFFAGDQPKGSKKRCRAEVIYKEENNQFLDDHHPTSTFVHSFEFLMRNGTGKKSNRVVHVVMGFFSLQGKKD